ncbi:MAG: hypothetical protein ACE1ZJ_02590 [Nitrospirales bacterium]
MDKCNECGINAAALAAIIGVAIQVIILTIRRTFPNRPLIKFFLTLPAEGPYTRIG